MFQTPERRNYVYVVALAVEEVDYEIYFMLQRAGKKEGMDLRLTVESAYPVDEPSKLPAKPGAIRFTVLATKVWKGEEVRFAPR